MRGLVLALLVAGAAAFTLPTAPVRAAAAVSRSASPAMHKPAGGGSPGKDKTRATSLRFINKSVFEADSKEKVEGLFTALNEVRLLKMNWRLRHHAGMKWKRKAAHFDVEVPKGFAAWDHLPRNAAPQKLTGVMGSAK